MPYLQTSWRNHNRVNALLFRRLRAAALDGLLPYNWQSCCLLRFQRKPEHVLMDKNQGGLIKKDKITSFLEQDRLLSVLRLISGQGVLCSFPAEKKTLKTFVMNKNENPHRVWWPSFQHPPPPSCSGQQIGTKYTHSFFWNPKETPKSWEISNHTYLIAKNRQNDVIFLFWKSPNHKRIFFSWKHWPYNASMRGF